MALPSGLRLIVNADDFGRSQGINRAVEKAHRQGILTTASLMVNEPFCDEAVAVARQNQRLGVGLHLALCCGKSAIGTRASSLTNGTDSFAWNPVVTGTKIFFSRRA